MKTYKSIKVKELINKVSSITCDKCKKTDTDEDWSNITTIDINFGFGSKFDTEQWTMDLCDDCIEELLSDYKREKYEIL